MTSGIQEEVQLNRLVRKYGGSKKDWQKVKAQGKVIKGDAEFNVELHWYELPDDPTTYDIKISKYLF